MSTMTIDAYASLGHVRVSVDAADQPVGTCVQVTRVGDGSPLRTHVWECATLGEWQKLSGGLATFWDNEAPLDVAFHYVLAFSTSTATVVSPNLTLASLTGFWLRDPARPCNDVRVVVCPTPGDPACVPEDSVFLQSYGEEGYGANAGMYLPTNARRGIPITRKRRDADSKLVLISRTFVARDALLTELQPGGALQFVTPPEYGYPDRYVQMHEVSVGRLHPDHRKTWRGFDMPFSTVDRPIGPAQGVCGARVDDLCGVYATWTAVAAASLSWSNLEEGYAGTPTPAILRSWAKVKLDFANWGAVAAKTWDQIRLGT